jgi:general secretion pathway protein D
VTTRPTKFKPLLVLGVAILVGLGGCATTRDSAPGAWAPTSYDAGPSSAEESSYTAQEPAEAGLADDSAPESEDPLRSVKPGTGNFINQDVTKRVPPGAGATGDLTFNFEGESLHAVIKALLGDFLQQNYVIAPGVQGTVTFSTAKPLRGDQALSILEMLLRWNNATMVWQDGRYTILPVAQALPGNLTPRTGPTQNIRGYEVRAIPLQYISALEMEKLLKPYAKPEAVINVDPARNMLVLAGSRAELENYLQTIATFDVDWLSGMSVGVFPMQQAEAAKTVTELEKIFGDGSNTPLAGMFRFMPLEGINAVMVITSQSKYLATVEEWLERLDIGGGEAGQRLYVYDVKNVKAIDLAATLGEIFGDGGGSSVARAAPPSGDRLMPGLDPVEIRTVGTGGNVSPSPGTEPKSADQGNSNNYSSNNSSSNRQGGNGSNGASGPTVDQSGGISLGASEEVRISASEENNALLVKATSGQWESIRRVIERLDTIPLQVHIEAKIVRVTLNDSLQYGVQWFFENGITDPLLRARARTRNIWGDIGGSFGTQNEDGGVQALGWTFLGPNAQAIITALDSVSEATVLSAPSLVVLNNKTANINVGTQIPVASSFYGGVGTNDPNNPNNPGGFNQQSYVQFRQTGITLDVTPRVNPGGLVFMEVDQQESAPTAGATIGGNPPVDNRSIKTEVAVQSGETLVLGGLIKTTETKGQGGFPGLSRIPFIGGLFGKREQEGSREELLVLITPHVIRNQQDARRLTEDYSSQFRGMEPLRVRVETIDSDQ